VHSFWLSCCKIVRMVASIAIDSSHIRPVDPRRDLLAIADLIEICFMDQMDEEGREYVRQIRHAAQSGDFSDGCAAPTR